METTYTPDETRTFSSEKVSMLVEQLLGTNSDSFKHGPSPQPWGAYIRKAFRHGAFGPRPESWQYYSPSQSFLSPLVLVALNPQPLPPRYYFMSAVLQELIDHVVLVHEVASAMNQRGQEQSIIIVSGSFDKYLEDFDILCQIIKQYIPIPKVGDEPVPHPNWDTDKFSTIELLIAANLFKQNALNMDNGKLQDELMKNSKKLSYMAFDRR